jgi:hypothetical protein
VDACRKKRNGADGNKVQVILRAASRSGTLNDVNVEPESGLVPLELIVRDNGEGMSQDPVDLVQLFASTKAQTFAVSSSCSKPQLPAGVSSASSGKFGVGLSASILHSHHIFGASNGNVESSLFENGGVCEVTTKSQSSARIRCVFGVDRLNGCIICVHRETFEDADFDEENGTEVRIIVPGGEVIGTASDRLRVYFQRISLTSHLINCSVS